jgi:hypothetical protein
MNCEICGDPITEEENYLYDGWCEQCTCDEDVDWDGDPDSEED